MEWVRCTWSLIQKRVTWVNVNVNIGPCSNLSGAPLKNRPCDRITHKCDILLIAYNFPIIPWVKDKGSEGQGKLGKDWNHVFGNMESEGHFGNCSAHSWAWLVWFYINILQSSVQTSCQTSKLQEEGIQSAPSMTSPMDKSMHRPDFQGTWKPCEWKTTPLSRSKILWNITETRDRLSFTDLSWGWIQQKLGFLPLVTSLKNLVITFVNSRCCKSHKDMFHKIEFKKKTTATKQ